MSDSVTPRCCVAQHWVHVRLRERVIGTIKRGTTGFRTGVGGGVPILNLARFATAGNIRIGVTRGGGALTRRLEARIVVVVDRSVLA